MEINWNHCWTDKDCIVKNSLSELVGETIKTITGAHKGSDGIVITTESGKAIKMFHSQDCCECVEVYDVDGDQSELVGAVVISADESSSSDAPSPCEYSESHTWTFYKIETSKGGLWIRWIGESNGYYSESVDIIGGTVENNK
jgi:hypothetical protein